MTTFAALQQLELATGRMQSDLAALIHAIKARPSCEQAPMFERLLREIKWQSFRIRCETISLHSRAIQES